MKETLKAAGYKGSDLRDKVNAALSDEGANRLILATAWLQSAAQQGYIPDLGEMRKSTGTMRPVKPKMSAQAITRAQALAALGLTEDDLAAVKLLAEKK